jgi:hypothetical protein
MGYERTRVAILMLIDGSRSLPNLAKQYHVWILDTPANRLATEALWALGPSDESHGVTIFRRQCDDLTDEFVVHLLSAVDEHHGLRADWAADVVLEVRGAALTEKLRAALAALGPFEIEEQVEGFVAIRTPPVGAGARPADYL